MAHGFMDGYRRYDPNREGYGSPREWRATFRERMGLDEAQSTVGSRDPHAILGVSHSATWTQIRSAYRKLALQFHPDRAAYNDLTVEAATERFKEIVAAYTVLEARTR